MDNNNFSLGVRISDLTDFHSQSCVKPLIIEKNVGKKAEIKVKQDGTYLEISEDGKESILESAKISLNDCLACSGCVTSAETVLITAQSVNEFFDNIGKGKVVVVSLSPQSRASIAAHFKLSIKQTHQKLVTMFKKLGVEYIFDTSFSREFALLESAAEFVARFKKNVNLPTPMLASACPGWICYAEKTHGEVILPYISTTKSPQQIMGSLVKNYFSNSIGLKGDNIYHCAIMPCYDKKLEASRDDFYNDILKTRDVDCVLTSVEILDIIAQKNIDFASLEDSEIPSLFTNIDSNKNIFGVEGGSGGYLEYIFKYAAKELFNTTVTSIQWKESKSTDFQVTTLEVDGKEVLCFAKAYGFKNIQNIIRGIKGKTKKGSSYHFVEIMACPSGCLNGGGQIKGDKTKKPKDVASEVAEYYNAQILVNPEEDARVTELYKLWLNGPFSADTKTQLHTQYHNRQQAAETLSLKW